jgi:homoserine kinase
LRWLIRVPATCANLGPGFDVLALAVELCNEVSVKRIPGADVTVDPGPNAPVDIERGSGNLIAHAYLRGCEEFGVAAENRGAHFVCTNRIPFSRGLGSSAAAIVSGVMAASALHNHELNDQEMVDIAAQIEGHPENVAAAAMGGVVICGKAAPVETLPVNDVTCVVFVPENEASTEEARTVVPQTLSRGDAVFNAGRCALLARAFAVGDFSHLAEAMRDRIHQPYRAQSQPALYPTINAALDAGAYGAALSGSGTSILALSSPGPSEAVATAMTDAAARVGVAGIAMLLEPRNRGAEMEPLS